MKKNVTSKFNIKTVLSHIKFKDYINYIIILAFMAYGYFQLTTTGLRLTTANMLTEIGYSIILAVSLNLVVGFLGELSLGHAAFMCVGAYVGGLCAVTLKQNFMPEMRLLPLLIALIIGGSVAALFGFIIAFPSLRLKGDYLAIVTLAFGEIIRNIFMNQEMFGAQSGLQTGKIAYDTRQSPTLFLVTFAVALVMLIFIQNLVKSKHGRAITAIRDNEIAAKAMGINVTFYKFLVFIIAAFFAGCAGVIYSHTTTPVLYSNFSYNKSIDILVMVVLGGMGSITGSIIAATFITYINLTLQDQLSGDLASMRTLVYAIILIVVVIISNAPALKSFRERYSIGALIGRMKKKESFEPSKKKDDEAKWARVPTKIKMDAILSTDLNPNPNASSNSNNSNGKEGK